VIALIVAIIAGVMGSHLSDDDDQSGYWPKDPIPLAHVSIAVEIRPFDVLTAGH
jgi:hypothetical protein